MNASGINDVFTLGSFPTLGGLLTFLTVIANIVLSLLTRRQVGSTKEEVTSVGKEVTIVKEYVNGNLKKMESNIQRLEARVETLMMLLATTNIIVPPAEEPKDGVQ